MGVPLSQAVPAQQGCGAWWCCLLPPRHRGHRCFHLRAQVLQCQLWISPFCTAGLAACHCIFVGSFIYLFIFNQEWLYEWQRNRLGCGDGAQGLSVAWTLAPATCTQRPAAARHPHWHTEGNPHWLFDRRGPGLVFGADPGTEMTHLPGFPSPGAMEGAFVSQEGPDCWGAVWHRCRNPACPGTSQ